MSIMPANFAEIAVCTKNDSMAGLFQVPVRKINLWVSMLSPEDAAKRAEWLKSRRSRGPAMVVAVDDGLPRWGWLNEESYAKAVRAATMRLAATVARLQAGL